MDKAVIVALDFPSGEEALGFLRLFGGEGKKPFVKIGMELFYSEGPQIVRAVKEMGHRVFLDLKLHDIPNTVGRAMAVLASLGADIVNLHASGGIAMMKEAVRGLSSGGGTRPLLIGVTQLTSTDERMLSEELLVSSGMEKTVLHYAKNALSAGLDGVVCSPHEALAIKAACGNSFLAVTPGIRFPSSAADDQRRIMTPGEARLAGSDYIVMGRPITAAKDPVEAYFRASGEFLGKQGE